MRIDRDQLRRFETLMKPWDPSASPIPAAVLGYGEISSIFRIGDNMEVAFKRMPLFRDRASAEQYAAQYREYRGLLQEAGITLPEDETIILEIPDRPVVLYIAQRLLNPDSFCHARIHKLGLSDIGRMIERIVRATNRVWEFNKKRAPSLELAIDGQLSNWSLSGGDEGGRLFFIDTSTPFFRKNGKEQLDPEPLLRSTPGFLLWIIRFFFLEDVMTRYYDPRLVFTDLVGNLHKEQRPDLIPFALDIVNDNLPEGQSPLTLKEVNAYYREDRIIWTLFLAFRRLDRWMATKLLRKRYEFILPGKIKR
ncbi:MAG: hypothetical protein GY859_00630 [Desulfobacterales bacterium]|nr:hypothetical protein [Desulfobacterales bacterium]